MLVNEGSQGLVRQTPAGAATTVGRLAAAALKRCGIRCVRGPRTPGAKGLSKVEHDISCRALAGECSDSLSRVEVSDVEVTCPSRDLVAPPSGVVHVVLTPDPLIEESIDE